MAFFAPRRSNWHSRRALGFWLTALAAACACYACSNPVITYNARVTAPAVVNLAIVLDMSGSMDASDLPQNTRLDDRISPDKLPPSRIATAKQHIRTLLEQCPYTRTALLAFAQNTILIAPLAESTLILQERLDAIQTEHFQDGTAIGNAIQAAIRALKCAPDGPKTILLLSDGVDHDQDAISPEQAAKAASAAGIVINAVGIGGDNAFHPVNTDDGIRWENVGEPMDMAQLQNIAALTGGNAFLATDAPRLAEALHAVQQNIRNQSREYHAARQLSLASILMAAAATLALAGFFLAHRTA